MKIVKVYIDPRARAVFASHYIYGLYTVFGKKNVKFRMKPFMDLNQKNDSQAFDHYFAILIKCEDSISRVVIDYRDKFTFNASAYNWCDIYGKVNLNSRNTPKEYLDKSISLGPMVAPRIWNYPTSLTYAIINFLRCWNHISENWRHFLGAYTWQLKRPTLDDYYSHQDSDKDYIFFDSTLWINEDGADITNDWRAHYIRTCRSLDLQFQGGLNPRKGHPKNEKYKDVLINEYVSHDEYIRRIKRSAVVFNTPSVHGGHGWKLGEFLAMGKAMVSTDVKNDLPEELQHGINVHFIKDKEEIRDAIQKIREDTAYRKKLEKGALEYYNTYLEPSIVIKRLLNSILE